MPKFLVMKKDASSFGSSDEGSFPVVKDVVEMPLGELAAGLLAEGVIKPMPEKEVYVRPAPEPEAPQGKPAPDPITVLPVRKSRAKK
jgi:hypothetical protein